jgi:hypothetical protein
MQSAGLTPPIKAVALLGNLRIRWDTLGAEHGVRGVRLFCPAWLFATIPALEKVCS